MPPVFFLCFLVGGVVLHRWHPLSITGAPEWLRLSLALVPILVAGTIAVAGLARFHSAGTSHHPKAKPKVLLLRGPYRWSRNPLYLALLLLLSGLSLLLNNLWILLSVPVLFLLLRFMVVPREEANLKAAFGEDYAAYCRRVRRWL